MCFRFFYSLQQTWHFKKYLDQYRLDLSLQIACLTDLAAIDLDEKGVKALVLDYDGVLAAHGEPSLRPEIIEWLSAYCKNYSSQQIYILTNKPTVQRQDYFKQNFPKVIFIKAKRKKPYPDGLQQIIHHANLQPSQVLLVDDRLCTGILATAIAGTQALWVTHPYINLKARPLAEAWFIFLRWLEKKIIKWFCGDPH